MIKKIRDLTLEDINTICNNNCNDCIFAKNCEDIKKYIYLKDTKLSKILDITISLGKKEYIPDNFHSVAKRYCNGELFLYEASKECELDYKTFKKKLDKFNYKKVKKKKYGHRYSFKNFDYMVNKYKNGEYSALECARLLGIGDVTFVKYVREQENEVEDD